MNPAPPVIRILSKSGIRLDEKLSYIFAGIPTTTILGK